MDSRNSGCSSGSSPRTRGTGDRQRVLAARKRFIPAHAGNSTLRRSLMACPPVHPRARGEQGVIDFHAGWIGGSSPRTRGTGTVHRPRISQRRFIPAHAGNRPTWPKSPRATSVHPRARGEQNAHAILTQGDGGSSPRTRGTVDVRRVDGSDQRFIPAHAGNSCQEPEEGAKVPVHPRARGEQIRQWIRLMS